MKSIIYVYSGTGNSLWTARKIAEKLGDTQIIPMSQKTKFNDVSADRVGFI